MSQPFSLITAVRDVLTGNAEYVGKVEQDRRLAICQACPARSAATNTCGDCHCWLPGKTKFAKSSCPRSKW